MGGLASRRGWLISPPALGGCGEIAGAESRWLLGVSGRGCCGGLVAVDLLRWTCCAGMARRIGVPT
jgi:hypothetical protein